MISPICNIKIRLQLFHYCRPFFDNFILLLLILHLLSLLALCIRLSGSRLQGPIYHAPGSTPIPPVYISSVIQIIACSSFSVLFVIIFRFCGADIIEMIHDACCTVKTDLEISLHHADGRFVYINDQFRGLRKIFIPPMPCEFITSAASAEIRFSSSLSYMAPPLYSIRNETTACTSLSDTNAP